MIVVGDSSALQNLQGLAALANLANNPGDTSFCLAWAIVCSLYCSGFLLPFFGVISPSTWHSLDSSSQFSIFLFTLWAVELLCSFFCFGFCGVSCLKSWICVIRYGQAFWLLQLLFLWHSQLWPSSEAWKNSVCCFVGSSIHSALCYECWYHPPDPHPHPDCLQFILGLSFSPLCCYLCFLSTWLLFHRL